jgi:hypothetical protein
VDEHDEVRDRELIRAVMSRYCHALDERDYARLRLCFTDDVHAVYAGQVVGNDLDELMAWFAGTRKEPNPNLPTGPSRQGMHFLGDVGIELAADGLSATTESYATVYHVKLGDPDTVIVRGVRYLDELRRDAGVWKIASRLHTADWAFETVATLSVNPADRVRRPPKPAG